MNKLFGRKLERATACYNIVAKGLKVGGIDARPLISSAQLAYFKYWDNTINDLTKLQLPPTSVLYERHPNKRVEIDALLELKENIQRDIIPHSQSPFSKQTAELINKKFRDDLAEQEYSKKTLLMLLDNLEKDVKMFGERLQFLHEEKVNDLLYEHPEWADEIRDKLYNLDYTIPEGYPYDM